MYIQNKNNEGDFPPPLPSTDTTNLHVGDYVTLILPHRPVPTTFVTTDEILRVESVDKTSAMVRFEHRTVPGSYVFFRMALDKLNLNNCEHEE